jgi:hypothetical protein
MTYELTYRPPKGSTLREHQQNRTLAPGTRRQRTVLSPPKKNKMHKSPDRGDPSPALPQTFVTIRKWCFLLTQSSNKAISDTREYTNTKTSLESAVMKTSQLCFMSRGCITLRMGAHL